jgi:predicted GNAT family N-acyltransferase
VSALEIRPVEGAADRAAEVAIRTRVFVEEQACPPEEEFDEHDRPGAAARHFLGRAGGVPVATARWRAVSTAAGPAAKLERFAVLAPHRGRGWGRAMVVHLLDDARRAGHRRFVVHAQAHLEALYAGLGFVAIGERFEEAGIPHLLMVRQEDG